MNFALPAVVIILLVLPGVLFSYFYRKGFWKSPVTLGPIQNELAKGLIWALVINWFAITIVSIIPCRHINFEALIALLIGWSNLGTLQVQSYMDAIAGYPNTIISYLLLINILGICSGLSLHSIVRKCHLDLRYDFLRFDNEWAYIFSGEARIFEVAQKDRTLKSIKNFLAQKIDFVFVSAVVEQGAEAILYWGILSDFYFDIEGNLKKIVLERSQRRSLSSDKQEGEDEGVTPENSKRFYPIYGDYLVIFSNEIKNVNVDYKLFTEKEEEAKADIEDNQE